MLIQMFSMQLLNIFYLLKNLKNCFFKQGYESVDSVSSIVIVIVTCLFFCLWIFFILLGFFFIPGFPYNFRYLVIVSFNFTMYKKGDFLGKSTNITSVTLLCPIMLQLFKNSLEQIVTYKVK